MNLLLFEHNEVTDDGHLRLTGRRARHLHEVLRVNPGDRVRIGLIGGALGRGLVLSCPSGEVVLEVELDRQQPPAPDQEVTLILALPRPIMLQRILKQGTVLGVRRFHLIRSSRVEKSFFHSPVLAPDKIRALLLEGMEQAMDTHLPEVQVHHFFKPFVDDILPALGSGLIAHPEAESTLPQAHGHHRSTTLALAIGPEGGWSQYEYQRFLDAGFHGFHMGPRILHVDTAVVALLAQVTLLAELGQTI